MQESDDSARDALEAAASRLRLYLHDWYEGGNYYSVTLLADSLEQVTHVLEHAHKARELVKALKEFRGKMDEGLAGQGVAILPGRIKDEIDGILEAYADG